MKPKGLRRAVAAVLVWAVTLTVLWFARYPWWAGFAGVLAVSLGSLRVMYRAVDWEVR